LKSRQISQLPALFAPVKRTDAPLAFLLTLSPLLAPLLACTSQNGPFHPHASCFVTIDQPSIGAANHIAEGTPINYPTNPPAGGPHYPRWATWGTHAMPIPQPYFVHNLEHGGVVFLYKCSDAQCTQSAQSFLEQVAAAIPTDSSCTPPVRVRVVIAPDATIPTPFAAAAWGFAYTAACADMPTLVDFAKTHYGHGPEDLCADGSYPP